MPVAQTSLEALDTVDVTTGQKAVLLAIRELHADRARPCDQDVAARLRWTINRVTPRRGELEVRGLVYRAGFKRGPTGRRVTVWAPPATQMQLRLIGGRDEG